jgi:hypothetical protein
MPHLERKTSWSTLMMVKLAAKELMTTMKQLLWSSDFFCCKIRFRNRYHDRQQQQQQLLLLLQQQKEMSVLQFL